MNIKILEKKMLEHISIFLEVNPDVSPENCVCQNCGEWFVKIDRLAPYHWEMCQCNCGNPITISDIKYNK
jgi:hypothetical protein